MSGVRFVLPGSWSALAGSDLSGLSCTAGTVREALAWLTGQYPVLAQRVLTSDGAIAPWTMVCLDDERVTDADTPLPADGELQVIAALMGG